MRLGRLVLPRLLLAAQRAARPRRLAATEPRLVAVRPLSAALSAAVQSAVARRVLAPTLARRPACPPRAGVDGRRGRSALGGAVQTRRLSAACVPRRGSLPRMRSFAAALVGGARRRRGG